MTQIVLLRGLRGMSMDDASLLKSHCDPGCIERIARNVTRQGALTASVFWTCQMQHALTFGDQRTTLTAERAASRYARTCDALAEIADALHTRRRQLAPWVQ